MKDEEYMSLALSLAKRRRGLTHPNPTVGCVVVKDGEIVGLGYHERAGYPHAEVVALDQAGEKAKGSTLYVTLEPCTHFGRTPPCTDAIIRAGVKRVVIATRDRNEMVGGKGIEKLKSEGIEVTEGVLEEEAVEINEDFFTYISKKRPYVTLKLAQTLDGRIATHSGDSKWITSLQSRIYAHRLRSYATAVLVGSNTILKDDPELTIRHIPFERNPLRVVIDPLLKTPTDAKVTDTSVAPTLIVFTHRNPEKEHALMDKGVHLLHMEEIDLRALMEELYKLEIVHLLVEGGAFTVTQFIKERLWDRLVIFQAGKILGGGKGIEDLGVERISEAIDLKLRREHRIGEDRVFEYVPVMEKQGLRW